jgi:hypothetical protein
MMAALAVALLAKGEAMWVVTGPCQAIGECIQSPNYPSSYGNDEKCTIDGPAGMNFRVHAFKTEGGYDHLHVNGKGYSGDTGPPSGVLHAESIVWSSDSSVKDSGWKLCGGQAATTTPIPTIAGSTPCDAERRPTGLPGVEYDRRNDLIEAFNLPRNRLNDDHDYAFASTDDGSRYYRRNSDGYHVEYTPPWNFDLLAIDVDSVPTDWEDWEIAYHGTHPEFVPPIIREGLKVTSHTTHAKQYGNGVYLSPYAAVSYQYSGHKILHGVKTNVVFQCRVRPGSYNVEDTHNSPHPNDAYVVMDSNDVKCTGVMFTRSSTAPPSGHDRKAYDPSEAYQPCCARFDPSRLPEAAR